MRARMVKIALQCWPGVLPARNASISPWYLQPASLHMMFIKAGLAREGTHGAGRNVAGEPTSNLEPTLPPTRPV